MCGRPPPSTGHALGVRRTVALASPSQVACLADRTERAVAGGQVHAMIVSLAVIVVIAALSAIAVPLLPRTSRPDLDADRH